MKKTIIIMLFLLSLALEANATGYFNLMKDGNTFPLRTSYAVLGNDDTSTYLACQFVASSNFTLCSVGVLLSPVGGCRTIVSAYIYSDNQSSPAHPGKVLATSSNTLDFTDIPPGYEYRRFAFSNLSLTSGTKYWIVLKANKINSTHYIAWGQNCVAGRTDSGNAVSAWKTSSTSSSGMFKTYSYQADNIIFQDNFDYPSQDWYSDTYGNAPYDWSSVSGTPPDDFRPHDCGGVSHYFGEITSGGKTGKSLKSWKCGTLGRGYAGALNYSLPLDIGRFREIYNRWYMKIPSDFDTTGSLNFLKLWRFNFTPAVRNGEVGLLFLGDTTFSKADFAIGNPVCPSPWSPAILRASQIPKDDQWHCWEVRVKLNSTGRNDGIVQFWLDGSLKTTVTNKCLDAIDDSYFTFTSLGTGNTGATSYQNHWRAIEFDDYVLSTSRIGCGSK